MSKKKNIPEIRFTGFDDEWEETELKQLVDLRSGRDYKHLSTGNIPVYGTGGYMLSVNEALSYEQDAIGIGRKGTIDKPYILRAPFWTVDTLFFAVPSEDNNIDFIYDIFQNINWKQKNEATGVPSLSKLVINKTIVKSTRYTEQSRIGSYFQHLDKLINLHQKKYDKLTALKKAMLEKMFPKDGSDVPEIRFKGFTDKWEERKLGEIGYTYTGLSGKTKEDFGHGKGQYVTYMNIFSNPVSNRDITEQIEIDNYQNEVQFGDVFFTTSSETPEEVGMSSVWLENIKNVYLNSFCFGYRPMLKMDSYFLAYMLRSFTFRKKITFLAQGISRYNISKNKVMEITIPIPNIKEQIKVGLYFQNLDNLISLHQKELDKLKNIKKACLEKMFV